MFANSYEHLFKPGFRQELVKYLKRDEPDTRIAPLKEEARGQLLKYTSDDIVTQSLSGAQLKLITVVFRGWEIVEMEETFA